MEELTTGDHDGRIEISEPTKLSDKVVRDTPRGQL
jgi:hypothetical protein